MRSMVVLFALVAVACGSYVPLAQPPYHPALVLDPHGRPLDTAEVISARALHHQAKALEHHAPLGYAAVAPFAHSVVAPAVYAAPAAVSHQSRVDVHSSPAVVSTYAAAPLLSAHSTYGYGLGLSGHGHYLKKRSLALGHLAYSLPSAVSHQSRVDVHSSPAVVSHAVHAAPIYTHAAPVYAHVAPSAVSHQSRVDIHSSPAVVSTYATAPLYSAHATPLLSAHSTYGYGLAAHGHYLKKRSLGHLAYSLPSAVSHQSRVDVHSSPAVVSHAVHAAPVYSHAAPVYAHAAPVYAHAAPVYAHATPVVAHVAPAAVSHQSRVDVRSSPAIVAHNVYAAPLAHHTPALTYSSSLLHSSPLVHAW